MLKKNVFTFLVLTVSLGFGGHMAQAKVSKEELTKEFLETWQEGVDFYNSNQGCPNYGENPYEGRDCMCQRKRMPWMMGERWAEHEYYVKKYKLKEFTQEIFALAQKYNIKVKQDDFDGPYLMVERFQFEPFDKTLI